MPLHVQGQVIRSRELTSAHLALERFRARVLAHVARELVGTRETPVAADPVAQVGLLTGVSALVSFQVGALRVGLCASGVVAFVNSFLFKVRIVTPAVSGPIRNRAV